MPTLTGDVVTNYLKNVRANGLGPRTLIVKIAANAGILDEELNAAINYLTTAHGDKSGTDSNGPDAFVVAGTGTADGSAFVAGTTQTVFLAVQGTGAFTAATVKAAAEGANANGTTFTVTVEAVFDQNYQ